MKAIISCRLALVLLCLWAGWCHSVPAREITDMAGRTVTVPDVIRKVYGASPPATLMVYAMDPGMVVGLNCPVRPSEKPYLDPRMEKLPVVGGWFGQGRSINLESLLAVKPDIVLVWWWGGSAVDEKVCRVLAPLEIPIVYLALDSLADYPDAFDFLGDLFHREERARALHRYAEDALDTAACLRAAVPDDRKLWVYYAEDVDGLSTECHTSVHAQLIPLGGAKNVHPCAQQSLLGKEKISMEQVLAYNPQVIVTHEALFFNRVFRDPKWQNIRAVRDKRVYRIPGNPFNWFDRPPSFMRLLGLSWMMHQLYPDLCRTNLEQETQQFFRLFLNVELDDAAIRELLQP